MNKLFCILMTTVLGMSGLAMGEELTRTAGKKMAALNRLIQQADKVGIDTLKEKMTVRTAEVFLRYADWDEVNKESNVSSFKLLRPYRDNAVQIAEDLPDFERQEVVLMLDEAAETLKNLIEKRMSRRPSPKVDWSKVTHDGDQLTYESRPVFLTDWVWKPKTAELDEYHGQQDGFFLMQSYVISEKGDINLRILRELESKPDGRMGFIFLNNKVMPRWAREKFGDGLVMREDTYTGYDIDHPGAREVNRLLLAGTVPYMAGKKYSSLGYMLCNEPHFFTTKRRDTDDPEKWGWARGPVSEHTIAKFRVWLSEKHKSIEDLNGLWGTSFPDFDSVEIDIPIYEGLQGTPKWYDWVTFNMDRVTDWYRFLKAEIRTHDPDAKIHLKIMPNLWTENERGHGIDLEALTRMSGIIGNDTGADHTLMWEHAEWEHRYSFEWREMAMGHAFMKSVSPHKIMYNTETHFFSTVRSRDLYMDPLLARSMFWLAHTQGLTASHNWYWSRQEDGSPRNAKDKGYAGSINHQPRVVNEVHSTIMDLNSHAEEIMAMQRQKKPIRIFYSKASAVNKPAHMDNLFELFESLYFNGIPLGFATRDILLNEKHDDWNVILVHKTEYATAEDINALQAYVNAGGTVIIDGVSLKKDEYGRPIEGLTGPVAVSESLDEMKENTLRIVADKGSAPPVTVTETNSAGVKGCTWKCIENAAGNQVLSIVNVGKTDARLELKLKNTEAETVCKNLLTGQKVSSTPTLKPCEVLFVELTEKKTD